MLKNRPNSDGAIVREVLRGDRERFDSLVERHLPAVYATALAHTRNSTDAEDIVQDAFLSAFTALDRLRAPARFGPWVITIARNTALKHLRRKKPTGDKDAREPTTAESPISAAQRKEFGMFLSEAIAGLPEGDREAILLHYFSGKSAREVAQALGVSRAAVLKRLERGRARLGKSLLDRLGDEETVRDALRPSIRNVTRGIAAAAVTWEASKPLTAANVLAASLSVLPKASTIAACLAGMGFTAIVGWNYLKSDAVEQIQAAPEPPAASREEEPAESPPIVEELTEVEPEAGIAPEESEVGAKEAETAPERVEQPSESAETSEMGIAGLLQNRLGMLAFEDMYLWDMAEYIERPSGLPPILIDAGAVYIPDASQAVEDENNEEREYFSDGMFESIEMMEMTLFEMLDHICSASGLSYISEPGFIWISTPSLITSEVHREPNARFDPYENEENAFKKASVVFNDIHLIEVLEFINETYNVNMMLDYRVVQPNVTPSLPRPQEIPQGYVSDGWVPYIRVRNIELRDLFEVLLRPLNLSYEVRDNAVVISSAERLAQSDSLNESLMTGDAMGEKMKAYRASMTSVQSSGPGIPSSPNQTSAPLETVRLLSIKETASGVRRAYVQLRGQRSYWYSEGWAIEQFRLIDIDLISGCCTMFDEELSQEFEICLPEEE